MIFYPIDLDVDTKIKVTQLRLNFMYEAVFNSYGSFYTFYNHYYFHVALVF